MKFKRAEQQEPEDDGYKRLLCTDPGCGRRWSVNLGKPLCSFHAWGQVGDKFPSLASAAVSGEEDTDGKRWARRLVALQNGGVSIRKYSIDLANAALRRFKQTEPA